MLYTNVRAGLEEPPRAAKSQRLAGQINFDYSPPTSAFWCFRPDLIDSTKQGQWQILENHYLLSQYYPVASTSSNLVGGADSRCSSVSSSGGADQHYHFVGLTLKSEKHNVKPRLRRWISGHPGQSPPARRSTLIPLPWPQGPGIFSRLINF